MYERTSRKTVEGTPGVWNDGVCTASDKQAIIEWNSVPGAVHLPQTSQTLCYNTSGTEIPCAGTGQDGDIKSGAPWPESRFTVSGECVTDELTGLMWAKNGNLPGVTWQGALDYIASMNSGAGLCDYNDWRLPNATELQSLTYPYTASNFYTWLNSQGFTGVTQSSYWTSTTGLYNTDFALQQGMSSTSSTHVSKTLNSYRLLPVRGLTSGPSRVPRTGQTTSYDTNSPKRDDGTLQHGVVWPIPRFTTTDACAIDNLTGLIWPKNGNLGGTMTWQEALDYAASLNETGLCGRTDWRLPNLFEMKSLVHHGQSSTATWLNLPLQGFSNVQGNYYWTSSNTTTNAWNVFLGIQTINYSTKSTESCVWPVSGRICYDNLARRISGPPADYPGIQDAYDAGAGDHELKARASLYCEDIVLDGEADLFLTGGYDEGFSSQTGYTVIYGSLAVMRGSVRIANFVIL